MISNYHYLSLVDYSVAPVAFLSSGPIEHKTLTSMTTRVSVLPINRYSLGIQEAPCLLRL